MTTDSVLNILQALQQAGQADDRGGHRVFRVGGPHVQPDAGVGVPASASGEDH
jgi:hypothetical protein